MSHADAIVDGRGEDEEEGGIELITRTPMMGRGIHDTITNEGNDNDIDRYYKTWGG